ncbi:VanZ family protein [Thermodesulfobacteriota bacterium]
MRCLAGWNLTLAILLGALMLITSQFIDKYTISDESLLENGSFAAGLSGWSLDESDKDRISVSDGAIHIRSTDAVQNPRLWQDIDISRMGQFVHFSGWVKTEQIVAGEKPWNMGRIILVQLRDEKADYSMPHVLIALNGTTQWQYHETVFPIHSDTEKVLVMIQMSKSTGTISCKNLALAKASLSLYYKVARTVALTCWVCLIAILFYPVFVQSREDVIVRVIILFLLGAIVAGTMMPGAIKNSIKYQIEQEGAAVVERLSPESRSRAEPGPLGQKNDHDLSVDITKVAHFFLFAMLTLMLLWSGYSEDIWYIILTIIILACGTELAQLFVEGRSALLTDVALDLAGCAFGSILWILLRKRFKLK